MIALGQDPRGVILSVRARPGAKRNEILDEHDGALRVAVTAAPEKGKANEAMIAVLAEGLNLRRSQIHLVGGATSRLKRFLIEDILADDLLSRIDACLEPTLFDPPDADI